MVQKWLKYVYKSGRSDDILSALAKIMSGNWQGLDLVRIQGKSDLYRCRVGDCRILFSKDNSGRITILTVGNRGYVYKGL